MIEFIKKHWLLFSIVLIVVLGIFCLIFNQMVKEFIGVICGLFILIFSKMGIDLQKKREVTKRDINIIKNDENKVINQIKNNEDIMNDNKKNIDNADRNDISDMLNKKP